MTQKTDNYEQTGAPNVDFLNSTPTSDVPKSTIGVRKIQPKRGVNIFYFLFFLIENC